VQRDMDRVREKLAEAQRVAVITGAGVSAESGVPTFRGKEGLWRNFNPMELATPEAFERDAKLVWEWYDWRRGLLAKCKPNPAHEALAKLEEVTPHYLLITQNVDGLHTLAGSRAVIELHGSIWRLRCTRESYREWEDRTTPLDPLPPQCECGALARPAVVWFGEYLDRVNFERIEAFFSAGAPDVVLVAGTSALFPYIQNWAFHATQTGGMLVEINPEPTPVTDIAHVTLMGKAGEILPKLIQEG